MEPSQSPKPRLVREERFWQSMIANARWSDEVQGASNPAMTTIAIPLRATIT